MNFSEKLKAAMHELNLNQGQLVEKIGKSKGSVSMYLNGKTVPSDLVQSEIALALGLPADYFRQDATTKNVGAPEPLERLNTDEIGRLLHKNGRTIRQGLKDGVFPWGYAIQLPSGRWSYVVNAKKFREIEGIA